ncbi:MAG: ankyrin repeat domain-containing protein [Candidatus Sulfotelmatobacter sp.]
MQWAAIKGYKNVAELLLANKADVNAKTHNGATLLLYADKRGYKDIADLLRQHGGFELPASLPEWPHP